jgi:hypothetical protein
LVLVAYQDGAVVSRTLLKRAGEIETLFAFDEGQSLSEHTAPFDAVAHVLEGQADITPGRCAQLAGDASTISTFGRDSCRRRRRFDRDAPRVVASDRCRVSACVT